MAVFYHLEMGNETETKHFEIGVGIPDEPRIGASGALIDELHDSHKTEIRELVEIIEYDKPGYSLTHWWIQNDKGEKLEIHDTLPEA